MADKAHIATDHKLAEMEAHLSAIYAKAEKEIEKKAAEYFAQFEKLDAQKRKLVDAGKLSEEEYKKWRRNKLMYGKHWTNMKAKLAEEYANVNRTALAYINGKLPEVYALNYNDIGAELDDKVNGYSFELVDAQTVKNLATKDETLLPYKYLNGVKDVRWNTQKVNAAVLQGILQGESIPNLAKRLQSVTTMNKVSAIRNARTTITSAECKGRQDSYEKATQDGIELKREWIAAIDYRTRHAHRLLDGQLADVDKPFKSELGDIMFPGDPSADPANVYNCRCTIAAKVIGFKNAKYNKSHGLAPTNRDGKEIVFSEKMQNGKWNESIDIITELCGQYKTKLLDVGLGAKQAAGEVQISGSIMRLSSTTKATAIHEFAHTISIENQTKFGLYDEKDFWKEIRGVQRKYKKAVADDPRKWISSYEHSSKGADEFMAEAFTHAQMKEMGLELPKYYGEDFTYSEMVLKIIKKYFGR